jgi:hypothetical protein
MMNEVYYFVCDPDECDALIEFHTSDGFGFPSGEVSMKCPCGRKMQYIQREETDYHELRTTIER